MSFAVEALRGAGLVSAPRFVKGLSEDELERVRALWDVWASKSRRNLTRSMYYDAKIPVKDLYMSTPPAVAHRINAIVGWPAKAVNMLADKTVFTGLSLEDGTADPFDLAETFEKNRFGFEFQQAVKSAYQHSCAFMTISKDEMGEIIVTPRSAETTGAMWDHKRRELAGLLVVLGYDEYAAPTEVEAYLPDVTLRLVKEQGEWTAERYGNPFGVVMAEPIVYSPDLKHPFGKSRISRPVMAITDNAMRTILRSEVSAEFYTAPRMAAIGVAEDAFQRGKWELAIDRWVGFTKDEDGDKPEVKQFAQMTMQPLLDQYLQYARQFAGESDIPLPYLGVVQDNPASAEAMRVAEKPLNSRAVSANRVHADAVKRLAWKILLVRDGLRVLPREALFMEATFERPFKESPLVAADGISKLVSAMPYLAESTVLLDYAGFSPNEIARIQADKRRADGGSLIDRMIADGDEG